MLVALFFVHMSCVNDHQSLKRNMLFHDNFLYLVQMMTKLGKLKKSLFHESVLCK